MTALNKQALREAAEKATPGRVGDRIDGSGSIKYECHGYDGSLVLRADHKDMEYGFIGDNGNADELFFRLCVPDVILALLDELEAAEKRIAELRDWNAGLAQESFTYQQKVAELEARPANPINFKENADADYCRGWAWNEVKKELSPEDWTVGDNCTYYGFFCWGWDSRRQFNEQRAAGIGVKGE